jgi:nitrogen fixation/metabolism regulation signal transduction histidine kinase
MREKGQKKILKSLLDISGFTNYVENPDLILSLIIEECVLLTRAEWGAILTYDNYLNIESFQNTKILSDEKKSVLSAKLNRIFKDIVGAKDKKAILKENFWDKKEIRETLKKVLGQKIRDIIVCPIKKKDEFLGLAVVVDKKEGNAFTKKDREGFCIICQETSIVLENIKLFKTKLQNEKMAAIGQTMTGIAHYIKNILQGITSSSYLLNIGVKKDDIATVKKAWEVVDKNTARISSLVMDMLSYSKERKLDMQNIDTAAFFTEIAELVRPSLQEKNIKFILAAEDIPEKITINEKGMHRSILNMLLNAAEVCDKPGSYIKLEVAHEKISHSLKLVISDNGKGMSKETSDNIFQPFYTKSKKGTGLGLAITKKVIEEHGGSIKVESEQGEGTSFSVSIPLTLKPS